MIDRIPRRYSIGLWLSAGSLAFILSLYHLSSTLSGGAFFPADHDSFYHGRRILDALADPLHMYQFDPRMHAPEGAWVTWPWAYDMLMAFAARALMALTGARDPMTVLAFIAPAWTFVNAALLLGVAARLGLSLPMRVLALLFFATSPLTQVLHRVGMLDHHFVEYSFVLGTLYLGLGWLEDLSNRRRAMALAALLGAAPAFHNGLFILQLPVLATLAWLWLLKRPIDRGGARAFAGMLVAASIAFLLPSEPFRNGEFSYYLQSWFHLYVAVCTAALCVVASMTRFTPATAAGICVLLAAMAAPTLAQLHMGGDFLFGGSNPYLERIAEFGSIPRKMAEGEWWQLTVFYSPLLWLLPLALAGLLWRLRRDASDQALYFVVQALFGSFLMLQTFRLHYFGSFALILPLCRLIDDLRELRPAWFATRPRAIAVGALALASLAPGLGSLRGVYPLGSNVTYEWTRGVYAMLDAACRRAPGAVLAEPNDGHFIRYHTECSNIADNFLTTPQDFEKVWQVEAMLAGPSDDVVRYAPYVRYILVKRADDFNVPGGCGLECPVNAGMRRELLQAVAPELPRLRLMSELYFQRQGRPELLLRLYEVVGSQ